VRQLVTGLLVGIMLVFSGCIVLAEKAVTVKELRCEYRVDPLGTDVVKPRLSWVIESDQRAQKQSAYQILVADGEENLKQNKGSLWDTGKVESDQTTHIVYQGRPLASQMRCYWKVRIWDKDGKASAWSKPAMWSMGLLRDEDWKALWIGYDAPLESSEKNRAEPGALLLPPPRYLRKDFTLKMPIRRAAVYATALGIYELHINGERVGRDYFTPGWTDYDTRVYYNTYDVTSLLRKGDNSIGAILADGWYAGHIGWKGDNRRDHYGSKTRLRAQLHVEYADGTTEIISTDRSWKASTGPLQEADFLMGETYDARKEMPGWDAPGFEDRAWQPVNVTTHINAKVQAYPGVTVRKMAEIKPVKITEPTKGVYVFDLGQNFAGFVRLKVTAKQGKKIVLRFAERLNRDGTAYTANLRSARSIDTYICRGGREETWQPRFTFHGFQYVEVTGFSGKPGAGAITGVALSSDTPVVGSFECSDRMANQLYSNIYWSQRANFIDIPTDCPQRDERMGWTGDSVNFVRSATFNTDIAAFYTKWLVDLEDAQSKEGAFPDIAPRKVHIREGTAAWADAGVICPWTIYQVYGDKRIIEKHYKAMARWIEYCRNNSDQLLRSECWPGDWLNIQAETPKDVIATAFFAYSTNLMSRIAEALGKKADAAKYNHLFKQIKQAFNNAYVAENGRIKGNTQTAYVLALKFDLLPNDKRSLAADYLVDDIKQRNWHLSTGFVGTKNLMTVLTDIGRPDVAYRLFHNDTFPSWGFSIRHGATSIWERWDGWTPEKGFQNPKMNSFCHYSFGAVCEWMFKTVGGIDTDGPGYKRIIIRPRPGGKLTYAKTSYKSIHGKIATHWRRSGNTLKLDITIPANTTATVYMPARDARSVRESGRPAAESQAVQFLHIKEGCAVFAVGSGRYRFISAL